MKDSIPNQFHFIFGLKKQTEPFHLLHYLCIESCFQINKPERIYFYYHYEPYGYYWELTKKRIIQVKVDLDPFISKYRYGFKNRGCKKYRFAHLSDFIRLRKLIEHGGVYADIDTIFVNKIPDHFYSKQFILGREDEVCCQRTNVMKPSLCNAFIMSVKNSKFAKLWLSNMKTSFDGSWSNHSTLLPQELSKKHPDLIHIEPQRSFYKHMWTTEGIYTLLEGYDSDFSGVYSMHLWSHMWWSKKRRDFSDFHGGMITEEYIKKIDTTYNIVARRFLPNKPE